MKFKIVILFAILLIVNFSAVANDSLQVKKVRFFAESKFLPDVHIPQNKTTSSIGYDCDCGNIPSHGGNYISINTSQNKPVFNVGLSAGLSVKLSTHFFYELSLSYYHYNISSKQTTTTWYLSGSPDVSNNTYSYQANYNYIGLGNAISYHYKRFSFTNTLLFYQYINYKESSVWLNNTTNWKQSYAYSGNAIKDGIDLALISEHKIGYSFLNNRIVPYIGVNFNWTSMVNEIHHRCVWLPFISAKINF